MPNISEDGLLAEDEKGLKIILKGSGEWSVHQKFTIAHEIAHILLTGTGALTLLK